MWFGFARPAYAYIDPATTSYLIQIVSALVISLSVAIGVFFQRIQTALVTARPWLAAWWARTFTASGRAAARAASTAALTTDEPAVIDDDLAGQIRVSLAALGGAGVVAGTLPAPTTRAKLFADERTWRQRLPLALLACLGVTGPLMALGPIMAYYNNAADLPFSLAMLETTVIPAALVAGAGTGALLAAVRGRVFDGLVSVLVGAGLASWIQSLWLNLDTGSITGAQFPWNNHLGFTLFDTAVWIVLLAAPLVLRVAKPRAWRAVALLVPGLLLATGMTTAIVTYASHPLSNGASERYLSEAGLNEVSSSKNIIVFLVDATDESVIQQLQSAPDFTFGPLTGFTSFDQNVARYQETFPALPYLFTGKDFTGDDVRSAYYATAYQPSTLLPELKRLGYTTSLYTAAEDLYWSPDDIGGLVDNLSDAASHVNRPALLAGMVRLAAFSRSPLALQPALQLDPNQFSDVLRAESGLAAPYQIDDAALYQEIVKNPLVVAGDQPRFSLIHLWGAHEPYTLDAEAQRVSESQTNGLEQAKGTFRIIYTYLDQLRALGLYDSSTILIMADHGTHLGWSQRSLYRPLLPCLFVKPAGAATVPLAHSAAATYPTNFAPTIVAAAGGDPAPFGLTYFQAPEVTDEPRRFYWIRPGYNGQEGILEVFDISGDALNFHNWTLTTTLSMNEINWHR